ncbi:3-deoxy-manno-octulosonate cytidylyltransferase [Cohnella hongkongensis]|uniref:3-deoxy-manno-octulosonate cytidylyltransferase n=1 Tax=Cohnella hongkongensis TaxID=178337 RepID=A0ABV9FCF8_9BACL
MSKVVAIIPARYHSTRLPAKPLEDIFGKPMIQRVYEGAKAAKKLDRVIVATDDERIAGACRQFDAEVFMTDSKHENGTSRAAEVAVQIDADYIVIVQGDEPMIHGDSVDKIVDAINDTDVAYSLMHKITEDIDLRVRAKVITDLNGYALTFSRSRIPFNFNDPNPVYYKGVGVYCFEKDFLIKYLTLPMGPIEKAESIEFLRVLENGYRVKMVEIEQRVQCVDTHEDLRKVRDYFETHHIL